ncbi:MAG: hypothetical protein QXR19_18295 [Candidatus Jordarchaeaceae archaeon]
MSEIKEVLKEVFHNSIRTIMPGIWDETFKNIHKLRFSDKA